MQQAGEQIEDGDEQRHRRQHIVRLIHPGFPNIIAIASDAPVEIGLPRFDLNDVDAIARFILNHLELS